MEGVRSKEGSAKAPEGLGKPPAGRLGGCKNVDFSCGFMWFSRVPCILCWWLMLLVLGCAHVELAAGIDDLQLLLLVF